MGADFLWHSLLSYDFCAGEGELSFVCVVIFAVDLSGFFASSLSQLFQPEFLRMQVIWLKNDNCLLAMRIAAAIAECMISSFPPLTPRYPHFTAEIVATRLRIL